MGNDCWLVVGGLTLMVKVAVWLVREPLWLMTRPWKAAPLSASATALMA